MEEIALLVTRDQIAKGKVPIPFTCCKPITQTTLDPIPMIGDPNDVLNDMNIEQNHNKIQALNLHLKMKTSMKCYKKQKPNLTSTLSPKQEQVQGILD